MLDNLQRYQEVIASYDKTLEKKNPLKNKIYAFNLF